MVLICSRLVRLPVIYIRKSFLKTWGFMLETEHKIWGIVWLVGVYYEVEGPR